MADMTPQALQVGSRSGCQHDSLRFVQALATTGRRTTGTGITLRVLTAGLPGGALLTILVATALLAAATYLTRTTNIIIPTGT